MKTKSWIGRILTAPFRAIERAKGFRRFLVLLAYLLIAVALGLSWVWATALWGLPDIKDPFLSEELVDGDPFPIRAGTGLDAEEEQAKWERSMAIEQAKIQDALAIKTIIEEHQDCPFQLPVGSSILINARTLPNLDHRLVSWAHTNKVTAHGWRDFLASPKIKPWPFLDLTEETATISFTAKECVSQFFLELDLIFEIEAAKLEQANKLKEAWAWRFASLKAKAQESYWVSQDMVEITQAIPSVTAGVLQWTKHPQMTEALLRQALTDVSILKAVRFDSSAYIHQSLRNCEWALKSDPEVSKKAEHLFANALIADGSSLEFVRTPWVRLRLMLMSEPERSRRLIRIIHAHWLKELKSRSDFEISSRSQDFLSQESLFIQWVMPFETDQDQPVIANFSPNQWMAWHAKSPRSWVVLQGNLPETWRYFLQNHDSLMGTISIAIANQLYIKTQGKPPQKIDDLIGPYVSREQLPIDPAYHGLPQK